MKITLKNKDAQELLSQKKIVLPKYTSQLINLASWTFRATRKETVGQVTELIKEFPGDTPAEWRSWYEKKYPGVLSAATQKAWDGLQKYKEAMNKIDRDMVEKWVEDLLMVKTFVGLKTEYVVLRKVAELKEQELRLSTPEDESKGIDGYIGDQAVSVKPMSYKAKQALPEKITAKMIFYEKTDDGIEIEFDF